MNHVTAELQPDLETTPTQIGPYRIISRIASGGMGEVYLAEQLEPVRRQVAIKLIKLGMDTRDVIARFQSERQSLAMMNHPAIAAVYDAGATPLGRPYFVMEYVPGDPITQFCDRQRLSIAQRLHLFIEICRAVQHAHQKGVIHRDLKPSNLMVRMEDGRPIVKVIDFGIAKATSGPSEGQTGVTKHGALVGTPEYMSPEQAAGSPDIDTRTDVYSLGVVLYELLSGVTPFDARVLDGVGHREVYRALHEHEPQLPSSRIGVRSAASFRLTGQSSGDSDVRATDETVAASTISQDDSAGRGLVAAPARVWPQEVARCRGTDPVGLRRLLRGDLDWITMRALSREREQRYDTPTALADDIERHLRSDPVSAGPPSMRYRLAKFARRNRALLFATVAIAGALVIGLVSTGYALVEARRARDEAVASRESEVLARQRADAARLGEIAQRRKADESRATAEAVNKFLTGMLGSADLRNLGREATVAQAIAKASESIDTAFPEQPAVEAGVRGIIAKAYLSIGLFDEARPHAERAMELDLRLHGENSTEFARSLNRLAWERAQRKQLEEAVELQRRALAIYSAHATPEDDDVLSFRADLANYLRELSQYDESERIYREVLALRRAQYGNEPNQQLLVTINSLAVLLHDREQLDEAEALYREGVETGKQVLKPDHPDLLTNQLNLASILRSRRNFPAAEAIYVEILPTVRRVFGESHDKTATAIQNYSGLLKDMGRFREALPLARESLALRKAKFGDRDQTVLTTKRSIAFMLLRLSEVKEAIELQREVLAGFVDMHGEEHADSIQALTDLANALTQDGQAEEAESLHKRGVELALRVLGEDKLATSVAINSYAVFLHGRDRLADAEVEYRRALDLGRRFVGENEPDTLITAHNLFSVLRDQKKFDEARPLGERTVADFARVFGPQHPNTATAQSSLSQLMRDTGDFARAEQLLTNCLETRKLRLGAKSPDIASTQLDLAVVQIRAGRLEDASLNLAAAREQRRSLFPADDWRNVTVDSVYGEWLTAAGKFDEAEPILMSAYDQLSEKKGAKGASTRTAAERLARLHEAQGHADLAAEWREKSNP